MIPRALIDDDIEFFESRGEMYAVTAGHVYSWAAFPDRVRDALAADLAANPRAIELMADLDEETQLRTYAKCKFGGFNHRPDIGTDATSEHEHWQCGCTACPLESLFRGSLKVAHGTLTGRELEIAALIARGEAGKNIADALGITESTLNTHKKNIFTKVGVATSVDLATWATTINLI